MDLSGFKVFDFSEGVPYFSVTRNGLTFSKAVTIKLSYPPFVQLLLNTETKQVVLQSWPAETPRAVQFYRERKNEVLSVRWNSRDLISTLERMLGKTFESHGIRVDGVLIDDQTMLFDLNYAKDLV